MRLEGISNSFEPKSKNKNNPGKTGVAFYWSGLRGSNPPPPPWQGGALPNELNPHKWCLRSESNQRHEDFQSSALPTELQRRIGGLFSKNGDSDGARLSRELRARSFAALTVINCHSLPLLLLAFLLSRKMATRMGLEPTTSSVTG